MDSEKKATLHDWLLLNLKIGGLSFGSGGRALLYQDAVVNERGWRTQEEFREVFTLTQVLPGPNLANLSLYLGYDLVGALGAVLGLLCLALPGTALLLLAYQTLRLASPGWQIFFRGVSIGSLVLFFLLIEKNAQGLCLSHSSGVPAPPRKRFARWLLTGVVAGLSWLNFPISAVLATGVGVGLLVEFCL